MHRTLWLLCGTLLFCPAAAWAQKKNEAIVVFKDGFSLRGRVGQQNETIIDPFSGASFVVPKEGTFLFMDDMVRRMIFCPGPSQIHTVIEIKEPPKEFIVLHKAGPRKPGDPIPASWQFESIGDWTTNKWDRVLKVKTEFGKLDMVQRITDITPYSIHGLTVGHYWNFAYLTKEFDPMQVRTFVKAFFDDRPEIKDVERHLNTAKFLQLVGWYDLADSELKLTGEKYPDWADAIKDYRDQVFKAQADLVGDEFERMHKNGMHEKLRDRLDQFKSEEYVKLLSDKNRLTLQEMRLKYDELEGRLKQVEKYLKEFPSRVADRKLWSAACKMMLDELNYDTVTRLETFARLAEPHAKELQEGKKPSQRTEEVLALALSGWLQGDSAALPDVKAATRLYQTRELVQTYLRTDNAANRTQLLNGFTRAGDVSMDVLIPLLRLMPPVRSYADKLDASEPTRMSIEAPNSEGGSYLLKLPPEYNPQRAYPVLLLLQSHREKADILLKRWQSEAAKHGFILATPLWGGKAQTYSYSKAEHDIVLDTIRDLRWRFNVDSDRVFLFGWEQGANAALDIGLSHPDQFAGVLPMCAAVKPFTKNYGPNAQYVSFYVVEGDRNGTNPKETRELFKQWIRSHYPALYVEYKGRTSELFIGEFPSMMDWMSRKRRLLPTRGMGRYHTSGGVGEEFKTMRPGDNHFYWLTADEISPKCLSEHNGPAKTMQPATLQATLSIPNEADLKAGAKIWNSFHIRTTGVSQVTLSIAPNQIDFTKPVSLRINSRQVFSNRMFQPSMHTLLEELYLTGDRQRLVAAKIDVRP